VLLLYSASAAYYISCKQRICNFSILKYTAALAVSLLLTSSTASTEKLRISLLSQASTVEYTRMAACTYAQWQHFNVAVLLAIQTCQHAYV
jgi:hypothetical protein